MFMALFSVEDLLLGKAILSSRLLRDPLANPWIFDCDSDLMGVDLNFGA